MCQQCQAVRVSIRRLEQMTERDVLSKARVSQEGWRWWLCEGDLAELIIILV